MENNYLTEPAANGHSGKSVSLSSMSVTNPKLKRPLPRKGNPMPSCALEHHGQGAERLPPKSWFADTVAVMISRPPSKSAAMLAAAPALRSATVQVNPLGELPEPTERQRPRSSWGPQ